MKSLEWIELPSCHVELPSHWFYTRRKWALQDKPRFWHLQNQSSWSEEAAISRTLPFFSLSPPTGIGNRESSCQLSRRREARRSRLPMGCLLPSVWPTSVTFFMFGFEPSNFLGWLFSVVCRAPACHSELMRLKALDLFGWWDCQILWPRVSDALFSLCKRRGVLLPPGEKRWCTRSNSARKGRLEFVVNCFSQAKMGTTTQKYFLEGQTYSVPLIQPDLRREEAIHQIADALQYLQKVSGDIFNRYGLVVL